MRWVVPCLVAAMSLPGCDGTEANAEPGDGRVSAQKVTANEADGEDAEPADSDAPNADDGGDAEAQPPRDPNEPPPDYGEIQPPRPIPEEDELTVHALAGYTIVAIYAEPNLESEHLGYMRMGQRMMVTPEIADEAEGCKDGFHGLPTGGFACASKGLIVDPEKEPYMHRPPPPPRKDDPIPYDYAVIAKPGTAMWWRTADSEEIELAWLRYENTEGAQKKAEEEKKKAEKAKAAAGAKKEKPDRPLGDGEAVDDAEQPEDVLPDVDDDPPPARGKRRGLPHLPGSNAREEKSEAQRRAEEQQRLEAERKRLEAEKARLAELEVRWNKLPLHPEHPFLQRGNMISIGSKIRDKGHAFWRTARGGYVLTRHTYRYRPKDFHGAEIPADSGFPFGFVWEDDGTAAKRMLDSGKLKWDSKVEHRTFIDVVEEVEIDGRDYVKTAEGLYLRPGKIRFAQKRERPEDVKVWERWIDVDLENQILVAYEGDRPVYATLVSTGRRGTKEESFRTPKGQYRIRSKHISSSMAGSTATDGEYSIQDVPWAMFFEGNYALHGAFWHTRFGRVRSHGCVNLGPTDAQWLFDFAAPFLPEGWHGVSAHTGSPGTVVVVH